jgi:hypothetical protein
MIGLEKSKAAAGEISQSARALSLEDMEKLYHHCLEQADLTTADARWGIVRYVHIYDHYSHELKLTNFI